MNLTVSQLYTDIFQRVIIFRVNLNANHAKLVFQFALRQGDFFNQWLHMGLRDHNQYYGVPWNYEAYGRFATR
jgi:hypothetical protein